MTAEVLVGVILGILQSPEFASIVLTAAVAGAGLIGRAVYQFLRRKLTTEQLRILFIIAENAVRAAEQTGLGKTGAEKKAEAIAYAQTLLDAYQIKVNAAQLVAAIEAAVFAELNQLAVPEPEPAA